MQDKPKRLRAVVFGAAFLVFAGAVSKVAAQPGGAIVIVNGTRTAMIMLHIKDSRTPAWQADLLDRKPLGVQKEAVFRRDGNTCVFDLKAVFEDGHRVTKQRVDLCKSPKYVLADF